MKSSFFKCLYIQRYDMFVELYCLESLMPNYSKQLNWLSLVIRNQIWGKSDENRLAAVLNAFNQIFKVVINYYGEDIAILELYIKYLNKYRSLYSSCDLCKTYSKIENQIQIYKNQELLKEHWRQINPYFRKTYNEEDLLSKNLIELFEDFFDNTIKMCPREFLLSMDDRKFKNLLRGRKGSWCKKEELAAPSIEIAQKNHSINRWNPPNKRYLYLVVGDGSDNDQDVAFEELRIKSGEEVTIANFAFTGADAKIFNLDYEEISRESIFDYIETYRKDGVSDIISEIYNLKLRPTKQVIAEQIKLRGNKTKYYVNTFIGKLLLKEICDVIFEPLDKDIDGNKIEMEKHYKSFHVLAEFLESKGCAGLCYPSTRMKLIGKKGKNLVLFNAESAEAINGTFRKYIKD